MVCFDLIFCKIINGIFVCFVGVQVFQGGINVIESCWEYMDIYLCLKDDVVDFCFVISQIVGCLQMNLVCLQMVFNGICMQYMNIYYCGSDVGNISGVIKFDGIYMIIMDIID